MNEFLVVVGVVTIVSLAFVLGLVLRAYWQLYREVLTYNAMVRTAQESGESLTTSASAMSTASTAAVVATPAPIPESHEHVYKNWIDISGDISPVLDESRCCNIKASGVYFCTKCLHSPDCPKAV